MDVEPLIYQLKALAEPTRLKVACLVAQREWGGSELLERLDVSQPNLSRHLKMLREAGVIRERRAGRNAYYRLSSNTLPLVVAALAQGRDLPYAKNMLSDAYNSAPDDAGPATPAVEEDRPRSGSIEEWLL